MAAGAVMRVSCSSKVKKVIVRNMRLIIEIHSLKHR